jgi:hypothetical protein
MNFWKDFTTLRETHDKNFFLPYHLWTLSDDDVVIEAIAAVL